jgi:hypothetical protein
MIFWNFDIAYIYEFNFVRPLLNQKQHVCSETYLCIIIFTSLVQNKFEDMNNYKVDQLIKELRKELGGWEE